MGLVDTFLTTIGTPIESASFLRLEAVLGGDDWDPLQKGQARISKQPIDGQIRRVPAAHGRRPRSWRSYS